MPKRRRSSSRDAATKKKLASSIPPSPVTVSKVNVVNPFVTLLHHQQQDDGDNQPTNKEEEEQNKKLLQTVFAFLPCQKKQQGISSPATKDKPIRSIVESLCSALEGGEVDEREQRTQKGPIHHSSSSEEHQQQRTTKWVTPMDLIHLLLPWSVKVLLQQQQSSPSKPGEVEDHRYHHLEWKTLRLCLQTMISASASSDTSVSSTTILNTSTLHKLVPLAMTAATLGHVHAKTGPTAFQQEAAAEDAARVYCLLVKQYYRPPFETACTTILSLMASSSSPSSSSSSSRRKINSTETHGQDGESTTQHPPQQRPRRSFSDMKHATLTLLLQTLPKANPKKSFGILIRPSVLTNLLTLYHDDDDDDDDDDYDDSRGLPCGSRNNRRRAAGSVTTDAAAASTGDVLSHSSTKGPVLELISQGIFNVQHHMEGFRSLSWDIPTALVTSSKTKNDDDGHDENKISKRDNDSPNKFRCYQDGLVDLMVESRRFFQSNNADDELQDTTLFHLLINSFFTQCKVLQQQTQHKTKLSGGQKKKITDKLEQIQFRYWATLCHRLRGVVEILLSGDYKEDDQTANDISVLRKFNALRSLRRGLELLLQFDVYTSATVSEEGSRQFAFLKRMTRWLLDLLRSNNKTGLSKDERELILVMVQLLIRLNHLTIHDDLAELLSHIVEKGPTSGAGEDELAPPLLATLIDTYGKLRQLDFFVNALLHSADRSRLEKHNGQSSMSNLDSLAVVTELSRSVQNCPMQQLKQIYVNLNTWILSQTKSLQSGEKLSGSVFQSISFFSLVAEHTRVDETTCSEILPLFQEAMLGSVEALLCHKHPSSLKSGLHLCGWMMDLWLRCNFWYTESEVQHSDGTGMFRTTLNVLENAMTSSEHGDNGGDIEGELLFLACQRLNHLHTVMHCKQRLAFASPLGDDSMEGETIAIKRLALFSCRLLARSERTLYIPAHELRSLYVLSRSLPAWAAFVEGGDFQCFLIKIIMTAASPTPSSDINGRGMPLLSLLRDANFYELPQVEMCFATCALTCVFQLMEGAFQPMLGKKARSRLLTPCRQTVAETKAHMSQAGKIRICIDDLEQQSTIFGYLDRLLDCVRLLNSIEVKVWKSCTADNFHEAMRLNMLAEFLLSTETPFLGRLLEVAVALRTLWERMLTPYLIDSSHVSSLSCGDSCSSQVVHYVLRSTLAMDKLPNLQDDQRCTLLVSGRNLSYLMMRLWLSSTNRLAEEVNQYVVEIFERVEMESDENSVHFSIARAVVQALQLSDLVSTLATQTLFDKFWDKANTLSNENGVCTETTAIALTLLGDFLLTAKTNKSLVSVEVMNHLEDSIVSRAQRVFSEHNNALEARSVSYLVACLATCEPRDQTRKDLAIAIIESSMETSEVIESSFYHLLKSLDSAQFRAVVQHIQDQEPKRSLHLRLFKSLVVGTFEGHQLETLAGVSRTFLYVAIDIQNGSQADEDIDSPLSLISDMICRRDILPIQEHDLSMLVTSINGILCRRKETSDAFMSLHPSTFDMCHLVASTLLHRFAKQLFACVPSVVCLLSSMLKRVLYGKLTDALLVERGQKFTRLCESLVSHKEVYKKHVLCLIAEFVNAMKDALSPLRKASLSPAIFCLLDLLEEHERSQLNTLLDEVGRTMLRSIHGSYQKVHLYKGQ